MAEGQSDEAEQIAKTVNIETEEIAMSDNIETDLANKNKTLKKENEIKTLIKSLKGSDTNVRENGTGTNILMTLQIPNAEDEKGFEITDISSISTEKQYDSSDGKRHTCLEITETSKREKSFDANRTDEESKLVQNERTSGVCGQKCDKSIISQNVTTDLDFTSFETTDSNSVSLELTMNPHDEITESNSVPAELTMNAHDEITESNSVSAELTMNAQDEITESNSVPAELTMNAQDEITESNSVSAELTMSAQDEITESNSVSPELTMNAQDENTESNTVLLELTKNESNNQENTEINETDIQTNIHVTNKSKLIAEVVQDEYTEEETIKESVKVVPPNLGVETLTNSEITKGASMSKEASMDSKKQLDVDTSTESNFFTNKGPQKEHELVNNENKSSKNDSGASEKSTILQNLITKANKIISGPFSRTKNDNNDSRIKIDKDISTLTKTNSSAIDIPEHVTDYQEKPPISSSVFYFTGKQSHDYNLRNRKMKRPQINSAAKAQERTKRHENNLSSKKEPSCENQTCNDKSSVLCFVHDRRVGYWCKQCNTAKCEKCVNVAYSKVCVKHDVIEMAIYVQDKKARLKARINKNSKDCLSALDQSKSVFQRNEKQTQFQALYQKERIRQEFVSFHDLLNTAEENILHSLDKTVEEYASQYNLMEKSYGSLVEEEAHLMAESLRRADAIFIYTDVENWIDREWRKLRDKIQKVMVSVQAVPRIVQEDFVLRKEKTDLLNKFSSVVEPCEIVQTASTLYLEEEDMTPPIRICDLFSCVNSLYYLSDLVLEIKIRRRGKLEFTGEMKYEDYVFNYGNKHYLQDNQQYLVGARPIFRIGEDVKYNSKCKHVLIVTGQNTFASTVCSMGYIEDVRQKHGVTRLTAPGYRFFVSPKYYPWPFSSVADRENYYDISPEELRCIAYQTGAANYMACYDLISKDFHDIRRYAPFHERFIMGFNFRNFKDKDVKIPLQEK